jgi:hypothetical protein
MSASGDLFARGVQGKGAVIGAGNHELVVEPRHAAVLDASTATSAGSGAAPVDRRTASVPCWSTASSPSRAHELHDHLDLVAVEVGRMEDFDRQGGRSNNDDPRGDEQRWRLCYSASSFASQAWKRPHFARIVGSPIRSAIWGPCSGFW